MGYIKSLGFKVVSEERFRKILFARRRCGLNLILVFILFTNL